MTLGQEFEAFAETLAGEVQALERIQNVLCESTWGDRHRTGLNAPKGYAEKCTAHLAKITGFPIHLAGNLIEATQDTQAFVLYSSCMKSLAIKLSKVCNDLRLLSSGPRCGLREINLPAKQPGSSIMPGKVNPVIPRSSTWSASGHRQRPDRLDGGGGRAAPAQRVRAGDRGPASSRPRPCS